MTRGLKCNNPMDLMTFPTITWDGEQKPTLDPEGRLCTFDTIVNGIRAGAIDLLSYYYREELDTITGIIERYASSKVDNNPTKDYIDFMASYCNVGADDALVMTNEAFLNVFVAGIIRFEMGFAACTPAEIAKGVNLALIHSVG